MPRPRAATITRRTLLTAGGGLLAAGAAAAAVDVRILPGRSSMFRLLHLDGAAGTIPDVLPVPTTSGSFRSAARRGRTVGWTIAAPHSTRPLPVVVALHGYGDDHTAFFGRSLAFDRFLADHVRHGGAPFALAAPDGGRYWHHRTDGDDPGAMVLDEFLPLLAARGYDTRRVSFTGYSMGGYGALHLAGALGAARVSAVSALSPAVWRTAGDTARGAFDSADDFRANTVLGRQSTLDSVPVRIDCGTGDGFAPAVHAYVEGFPQGHAPLGGFESGGHDRAYWRRMVPDHVAFLGRNAAS